LLNEAAMLCEQPDQSEVSRVVGQNIDALIRMRQAHEKEKSRQDKVVDRLTRFAGSMRFVYFNVFIYGSWFIANLGWIKSVKPFDPPPFVGLALLASIEAIFLSTFILTSQNRIQILSEKRADLDLQINLLSEHEITRLIELVDQIARKQGIDPKEIVRDFKENVPPEMVLDKIEEQEEKHEKDYKKKAI
jgi:uncharacterized membrane protein